MGPLSAKTSISFPDFPHAKQVSTSDQNNQRPAMRLSYALLVAAAFVSSGNAVASTNGRTTELSAMTSSNAAAPIDAAMDGEKRSLRYHSKKDFEDESDDEALLEKEDADDEEERKFTNMFSTTKLDEMLDGTQVMSRFKKWKASGYNTYNLPDAIQAKKYDELRTLYRNFLYHKKA